MRENTDLPARRGPSTTFIKDEDIHLGPLTALVLFTYSKRDRDSFS